MIKLKDFILDEMPEKEEVTPKQRNKTEYTFTLEYENDSDFILKKTSKRTEKLLVCLVSQGQIYIKDNKNNTVEKVDDIQQIKAFRKGMYYSDCPEFKKLVWKPFQYFGGSNDYENFKLLLNYTNDIKELMNRKLNPFQNNRVLFAYRRNPEEFLKDVDLMKPLRLLTTNTLHPTDCEPVLSTLRKSNITYNNIKDNLDTLKDMGYDAFSVVFGHGRTHLIFDTYHCDFKSFVNWVVYTVKHRNRLILDRTWGFRFDIGDYVDYLDCQYKMYGKIREKYPENWLTDKQIMNAKYNEWSQLKKSERFTLNQERLIERVSYENKKYKVIVPITNTDILDEAEQQRHCVASYVDRICNGETNIVFIRLNEDLETSLLTVELKNNEICQVRGFQNRTYTKEEYDFMKEWSKKTGLKLVVPDVEV